MIFKILTNKDKIAFARNMAIMSRVGMQIPEMLRAMQQQVGSKGFKKIIKHLIKEVENGSALHAGLQKYENEFGSFFINVVKVGEISGTFSENLEYLADALERSEDVRSKAKGAMIYPAIILASTLGMGAVMIFFIFPKILPLFKTLKVELPLSTKILIAIANAIINHGLLIIILAILLLVTVILLLKIKSVKYTCQYLLLRIPVFGKMIRDFNVAQLSRTISLLLKSGVKIVQTLNVTADTTSNLVYKKYLKKLAHEAGAGELISTHLAMQPVLFPVSYSQMVAVGEKTGKLNETQLYLANFYDKEFDSSTKAATTILEPLLLLIMGLTVGFIAISIITPIYEITRTSQF